MEVSMHCAVNFYLNLHIPELFFFFQNHRPVTKGARGQSLLAAILPPEIF